MQLQFHIRDQGIGMDAETVSRLFQRFAQGDNSTSRRFGSCSASYMRAIIRAELRNAGCSVMFFTRLP